LGCFIKRHPNAAWIAYILLVVYALIVGYHFYLFIFTKYFLKHIDKIV
jgi:hypothetical protein